MKKFLLLILFAALPVAAQMHQRFPASTDVLATAQSASINTTTITVAPGIYNVCWVQQITRAATVSSALLTTIGWNNGSAKSTTLFSLNGGALQLIADSSNVLNSTGSGCVVVFSADGAITYGTTYASVGATTMLYGIYVTAERLQ